MNQSIYKYIQEHFSQAPKDVDRLIVSSFFRINNIEVKNNRLIKSYIIGQSDSEASKKIDTFIDLIKQHFSVVNIEAMIELFEFVISPSDRIVTGAVYTPLKVRDFIIADIFSKTSEISRSWKASDIACGCGGFLYTIVKKLRDRTKSSFADIYKHHIFGLDIKSYSIDRTKILLSTYAISEGEDIEQFEFNLYEGDALEFDWKSKIKGFEGFNCIAGNPPYVCSRSIPEATKKYIDKWVVCKSGHPDLYIPFFQIGIENLIEGGILGYITMNTFFKSVNGRALRKYFEEKSYSLKIIDFGSLQIFKTRSTYTCICIIEKKHSSSLKFFKCESIEDFKASKILFHSLEYSNLNSLEGWNLSVNSKIIAQIESAGTPLSKKFKSRNGIATLKNNIYIFNPAAEDRHYYYIQSGDFLYPIEKAICRDIVNPNMLTNETSLANITEKIIFPYEFIKSDISLLKESIFRANYPSAYAYLFTKKTILATRDKGKGIDYKPWYKFGRNQSLEKLKFKLLFPHITPKIPNYIIDSNEFLFFYNGIAIIGKDKNELVVLKKILASSVFWFYIKNTSKPYGDSYYSLSKNYFKNFAIPKFSSEEEAFLTTENDQKVIDSFLEKKYGVELSTL